ncbi:MAG: PIN domain-containing protein [Candidatus Diapherotrites archaeon]
MPDYFVDTYALVEFFRGNRAYKGYFLNKGIVTCRLNLMELYYSALIEGGEELAERYYESLLSKVVEFGDETIKNAMKLRFKDRAKKFSYVDAVGYEIARELKIKFLTGDKAFKGMENVEFVK